MKLLIQSAMIFFGTLMAAAVVAWGEPAQRVVAIVGRAAAQASESQTHHAARGSLHSVQFASSKGGISSR